MIYQMFKNKKRIVPVLVAVVIALFSSTIGAFAAGNPYVTIVNPIQNSKIEGNSFLVSVKIAKAERLNHCGKDSNPRRHFRPRAL